MTSPSFAATWDAMHIADNLLSQATRFLLDRAEAESMIDDMERTVLSRWYDIARAEGVTDQDCDGISGAFAYPGFRLEPGA